VVLRKSDLYSSLWKSCDELRGGMDASQYKDYILVLLFVKYVSDKKKTDSHSSIDVPDGGSFDEMLACKDSKDLGDKINKIIGRLAEANGLEKVIDLADFNDEEKLGKGREMQDRLSKLLSIFTGLDFRGSKAEGDDLLGDAYEYLMRHFAIESGKSKGQFYTPAEVSWVLAKVVGIGTDTPRDSTVYDPTCGSGSLLLKVAAEAPSGIAVYGQEKDNATWALCKMNMILHGNETADIRKGDTISSPQFTTGDELETFHFAVANPPFSVKSWSNGLENEYGRFAYGMPPAKNGDYAFLLHVLQSLKSKGKAAVILPHGVLFRGNAEAAIRKKLLDCGYIKGVIGLPVNLFYGTSIPACIVVLDKEHAPDRSGVFLIDASKGFMKDGPKNRLRSRDIHKIVDVFTKQTEIARYSRMVSFSEIGEDANDGNLNISRYIDSSETEDIQDLHAHFRGGIPDRDLDALGEYWKAFPKLRPMLFQGNRAGYSDLAVNLHELQQTIYGLAEFQKFSDEVHEEISAWFASHRAALESIHKGTKLGDLLTVFADDLLDRFTRIPLLDEYGVYEQFMTYWHDTMCDDVFLLMKEGWVGACRPRSIVEDKHRKFVETPDLVIGTGRNATKYKTDLISPELVIACFLPQEQAHVHELCAQAEEAARVLAEYLENHADEDGLLAEMSGNGKINKARVTACLKEATQTNADSRELGALQELLRLYDEETAAKRAARAAQKALDHATFEKYGDFSEATIRVLLLDHKWKKTIMARIDSERNAVIAAFVHRIQELGERYGETLEELTVELAKVEDRLLAHLTNLGVT